MKRFRTKGPRTAPHRFPTSTCGARKGSIGSQPVPVPGLRIGSEPISALVNRGHRFSTNSRRQGRIGCRPKLRHESRYLCVWARRPGFSGLFASWAIGWEVISHRFPTSISWVRADQAIESEPMLGCRPIVERRWITRLRAEVDTGRQPMLSTRMPCGTRRRERRSLGNLLKSGQPYFAQLRSWFRTDAMQKAVCKKNPTDTPFAGCKAYAKLCVRGRASKGVGISSEPMILKNIGCEPITQN